MKDGYTFVKDYKENNALRKSLNDLAGKTFAINLEQWYQSGYWKEKYIPYSIAADNKIISNVSVNKMDFVCNDGVKHYIQLGTVMTDKDYRGMGLSKFLIETILEEYKDQVEGIYLFANDSVLNFYPKFGFTKSTEYQYSKNISIDNRQTAIPVPMDNLENRMQLVKAMQFNAYNGQFEMDNIGLIMFYIVSFMGNHVYYIKECDAYVIAKIVDHALYLYHVLSKEKVKDECIINAFGSSIDRVVLEFTPIDKSSYDKQALKKEDTTLFIMGDGLADFDRDEKMFPTISHA